MPNHGPAAYSKTQIALHWTVAVLVILQVLLHDGMADARDAFEDGEAVEINPLVVVHIAIGVSILVLVLWRIGLRWKRGAPPLPDDHPAVLKLIAHANHFALYGLLIAMPLTGATAWFLGVEDAAEIHEAGKTALLVLVGLHIAGALAEHFVMKTNVLRRMLGLTSL